MKKVLVILFIAIFVFSLAGCSNKSDSDEGWTISLEGVGKEPIKFTNQDAQKIGLVTIKATMKNKDSSYPEQEWEGVSLEQVLEHYGIKNYITVKVEGADGSAKEYTPDLVFTSKALLGLKVDGKKLNDKAGPVQLVVNGKGQKWWIKKVTKITVIK